MDIFEILTHTFTYFTFFQSKEQPVCLISCFLSYFVGRIRNNMEPVRAAGFIIYRKTPEIQFLLLQCSQAKHWSPPKGHVDPGESDYETALRETVEESGFSQEMLKIITDFKVELNYEVKSRRTQHELVPKVVTYWLAELMDFEKNVVKLSHEHQDFKWLPLKETCDLSGFKDMNEAFEKSSQKIESL